MRSRKVKKLIREAGFAAEVEIEFHYSDESWSPTMSGSDARKLETVKLALRAGDLTTAARHGKVFELKPVGTEAAE